MDLWIRTQNRKSLLKTNRIDIAGRDEKQIICDNDNGTYDVIGEYKSQTRALEILDEIQAIFTKGTAWLKTNGLGETIDIVPKNVEVYEMPEE